MPRDRDPHADNLPISEAANYARMVVGTSALPELDKPLRLAREVLVAALTDTAEDGFITSLEPARALLERTAAASKGGTLPACGAALFDAVQCALAATDCSGHPGYGDDAHYYDAEIAAAEDREHYVNLRSSAAFFAREYLPHDMPNRETAADMLAAAIIESSAGHLYGQGYRSADMRAPLDALAAALDGKEAALPADAAQFLAVAMQLRGHLTDHDEGETTLF